MKPQPSISVQFGSEWRIKRPYLYRYLEKQYVDSFFDSGLLRLSSFEAFSKHKDEQRLDSSEGKGIITHVNSEGTGQTIMAAVGQGHNCYVLCSATFYATEIADDFAADSGFRINDVLGFANAVSRQIPGFVAGLEGPCHYLQKKVLDRDVGHVDLDSMRVSPESKNIDMDKLMQTVFGMAGDDLFFIKHSKYASQNEYRLLWSTINKMATHIDIECPEAIQFCTRFEDLRAENGK